MKVSVVIPCYNSEKTIRGVVENIASICVNNGYDYEFVLVNDYSKDDTKNVIWDMATADNHIIGVDFARNAGQHAAIMAGLRKTTGDIVICSDDDGQTPVENIPLLINKLIDEKRDVVCGKYVDFEKKSAFRKFGTKMYFAVTRMLVNHPDEFEFRVFFAARRYVVNEVCKYNYPFVSLNGLFLRVTQNVANIDMVQHSRKEGKSNYSLKKLFLSWTNGFIGFSIVPLRFAGVVGLITSFLGFMGFIWAIVKKIVYDDVPLGWSSTTAAVFFFSGLILFVLGVIGEYIGRMYLCMNGTPQSVIKESINDK